MHIHVYIYVYIYYTCIYIYICNIILHYIISYYIVLSYILYYTILHYIILYHIILYSIVLFILYYIISYYIKLSYLILYHILLYYIISYQCTHPCQEGETMSDYHLFLMILESETIIFHGVVSLFLLGFSWSSIVCLCSFTYFKMILNDFKPSFPVIFYDFWWFKPSFPMIFYDFWLMIPWFFYWFLVSLSRYCPGRCRLEPYPWRSAWSSPSLTAEARRWENKEWRSHGEMEVFHWEHLEIG